MYHICRILVIFSVHTCNRKPNYSKLMKEVPRAAVRAINKDLNKKHIFAGCLHEFFR